MKQQFLLKALKEKKDVILKDRFSSELEDALAPLMLARSAEKIHQGNCFLINNVPETKLAELDATYARTMSIPMLLENKSEIPASATKRLAMTKFRVIIYDV